MIPCTCIDSMQICASNPQLLQWAQQAGPAAFIIIHSVCLESVLRPSRPIILWATFDLENADTCTCPTRTGDMCWRTPYVICGSAAVTAITKESQHFPECGSQLAMSSPAAASSNMAAIYMEQHIYGAAHGLGSSLGSSNEGSSAADGIANFLIIADLVTNTFSHTIAYELRSAGSRRPSELPTMAAQQEKHHDQRRQVTILTCSRHSVRLASPVLMSRLCSTLRRMTTLGYAVGDIWVVRICTAQRASRMVFAC